MEQQSCRALLRYKGDSAQPHCDCVDSVLRVLSRLQFGMWPLSCEVACENDGEVAIGVTSDASAGSGAVPREPERAGCSTCTPCTC